MANHWRTETVQRILNPKEYTLSVYGNAMFNLENGRFIYRDKSGNYQIDFMDKEPWEDYVVESLDSSKPIKVSNRDFESINDFINAYHSERKLSVFQSAIRQTGLKIKQDYVEVSARPCEEPELSFLSFYFGINYPGDKPTFTINSRGAVDHPSYPSDFIKRHGERDYLKATLEIRNMSLILLDQYLGTDKYILNEALG